MDISTKGIEVRSLLFCAILFFALFISCDNDDYPYSEIPSVILNRFWTQFPDATEVVFRRTGMDYEVEFETDDKDFGVLIASTGNVLREKKEISLQELPPDVLDSLEGKYGQKKINDPEVIRSGDKLYYQVQVKRFLADKKLVVDRNGNPNSTLDYWE